MVSVLSYPSVSAIVHIIHGKDFWSDMITSNVREFDSLQDKSFDAPNLAPVSKEVVFDFIDALLKSF